MLSQVVEIGIIINVFSRLNKRLAFTTRLASFFKVLWEELAIVWQAQLLPGPNPIAAAKTIQCDQR